MARGKTKKRVVTILPRKNKELREMMERFQGHFTVAFVDFDSSLDMRSKGRNQVGYSACCLEW